MSVEQIVERQERSECSCRVQNRAVPWRQETRDMPRIADRGLRFIIYMTTGVIDSSNIEMLTTLFGSLQLAVVHKLTDESVFPCDWRPQQRLCSLSSSLSLLPLRILASSVLHLPVPGSSSRRFPVSKHSSSTNYTENIISTTSILIEFNSVLLWLWRLISSQTNF